MIQAQLLKYVATKLGPWLIKFLWPLLEKFITEIAADIFDKLKDRTKETIQDRLEKRRKDAQEKANKAESDALSANSDVERKSLETSAQIWREVAEQLKSENESLRAQLKDLTEVAERDLNSQVNTGNPSFDTSGSTPVLIVQGKKTALPALPPPDN